MKFYEERNSFFEAMDKGDKGDIGDEIKHQLSNDQLTLVICGQL